MKPHPYRLRPYHNPEQVDESKVLAGKRLLYADELPGVGTFSYADEDLTGPRVVRNLSIWLPDAAKFGGLFSCSTGLFKIFTYIVPVDA
jgi:hypothetical protein